MATTEEHCYGRDCVRPVHSKGLCGPHYNMKTRLGHADKALSFRRPRGWLTQQLKMAAAHSGNDCFKVTMPSRDRVVVNYQGSQMYAARAVWHMAYGDPGSAFVLHTCGNGHAGCIGINHLYLGDHGLNMRDKVIDDTSARGSRNRHAKLTEEQVQSMRRFLNEGGSCKQAAGDWRVSLAAVTMMTSGVTWGWLPWPDLGKEGTVVRFKAQRTWLAEGRKLDGDTGTEGD